MHIGFELVELAGSKKFEANWPNRAPKRVAGFTYPQSCKSVAPDPPWKLALSLNTPTSLKKVMKVKEERGPTKWNP